MISGPMNSGRPVSIEKLAADDIQVKLLTGPLTSAHVTALSHLANASQAADGAPPFSDQTLVELRRAGPQGPGHHQSGQPDLSQPEPGQQSPHQRDEDAPAGIVIVCAWVSGTDGDTGTKDNPLLAGAGVVVIGTDADDDAPEPPKVLELTVHPDYRSRGVATLMGTKLADTVLAPAPASVHPSVHRAWAHGGHPAAPRLASRFDWVPVRELWRMRLSNDAEVRTAERPEGVTVRSFAVGRDEEAWLAANARAFSDHPEQGQLTVDDLQARMAEDWFDPEGFFLAEENGVLLGFHWTKIHPPKPNQDGAEETLGEVYVVGAIPEAQGRGMGLTLTSIGIEHLRSKNVDAVILYVDSSNTAAVELYKKLGFTVWDVDTQYAPAAEPVAARAASANRSARSA